MRVKARAAQRWRERALTARRFCLAGVLLALCIGHPVTATLVSAETLRQALASAYSGNPRLDAERARLRATDEEVPRALSGYRPRVTGSADGGISRAETKPDSANAGEARPWGYSLTVSQSVFNGFRTGNAVGEAEAQVRAGRELLREVESQVLLDAATAFADVVRDGEVLRFREANVAALSRVVQATEARQAAREVTRTDVAQARSRLARALAQQDLASGNLKASRATYTRVVGHPPAGLVAPSPPKKHLPRALEEALAIAERESPGVVGALYREAADRHGVARIRGELMPEFRVEANYGMRHGQHGGIDQQEAASVTGRLSMPLYEGGETHARVRQAKHRHVARLQEIEQARQEAQASVTQAWARYQASRGQLRANGMAAEAARLALEGVREEERGGQRTVLDILNAEQEHLDAQVQVVSARRDLVVAAYTLLAQMGRLTATELELADPAYDAEANYLAVRNRWFGLDITRADGRRENLNVAVDADPNWSLDD
jgi:outer membrane protein